MTAWFGFRRPSNSSLPIVDGADADGTFPSYFATSDASTLGGLAESDFNCAQLAKALEEERSARSREVADLKACFADSDRKLRLLEMASCTARVLDEVAVTFAGTREASAAVAQAEAGLEPESTVAEPEAVAEEPESAVEPLGAAAEAELAAEPEMEAFCGPASREVDTSTDASSAAGSGQGSILFAVTCDTKMGFSLRVVGSLDHLGLWDPARGLKLETSEQSFPTWRSTQAIKASGAVQYKYVLCNDDLSSVCWDDGANRHVEVAASECCTLATDVYGKTGCSTVEVFATFPEWARAPKLQMPYRADARSCEGALVAQGTFTNFEPEGEQEAFDPLESLTKPSLGELVIPGPMFSSRYRLAGDEAIGEGSFGLVWRCSREHSTQDFAVKVIKRALLLPRDVSNLLGPQGEVRTHQALYHAHIVQLIECFDETDTISLVMECCLGGDLFEAIERRRQQVGRGLPEVATARVMRHVLDGLAYLHTLHIAHRDVKAENVLLNEADVPFEQNAYKLCDFGFAARDDGHGITGCIGSPYTVAPEIVTGKTYDVAVDLWSSGVLMYMALAAKLPFEGDTRSQVLRQVMAADYSLKGRLWDTLPAPCKGFLASLLTKSPSDRPTAAKALKHVWFSMFA